MGVNVSVGAFEVDAPPEVFEEDFRPVNLSQNDIFAFDVREGRRWISGGRKYRRWAVA